MITESTIYWITRLDGIKVTLVSVSAIASTIISIAFIVVLLMLATEDIEKDRAKKISNILLAFFAGSLILIIANVFIPTTKEMCAIKIIPRIANNEKIQELPDKLVDLAGEWMEELRPKKDRK